MSIFNFHCFIYAKVNEKLKHYKKTNKRTQIKLTKPDLTIKFHN